MTGRFFNMRPLRLSLSHSAGFSANLIDGIRWRTVRMAISASVRASMAPMQK